MVTWVCLSHFLGIIHDRILWLALRWKFWVTLGTAFRMVDASEGCCIKSDTKSDTWLMIVVVTTPNWDQQSQVPFARRSLYKFWPICNKEAMKSSHGIFLSYDKIPLPHFSRICFATAPSEERIALVQQGIVVRLVMGSCLATMRECLRLSRKEDQSD